MILCGLLAGRFHVASMEAFDGPIRYPELGSFELFSNKYIYIYGMLKYKYILPKRLVYGASGACLLPSC
jgi:hypothetical protein